MKKYDSGKQLLAQVIFGYTFNFKKILLAESALTVPLILIIVSY